MISTFDSPGITDGGSAPELTPAFRNTIEALAETHDEDSPRATIQIYLREKDPFAELKHPLVVRSVMELALQVRAALPSSNWLVVERQMIEATPDTTFRPWHTDILLKTLNNGDGSWTSEIYPTSGSIAMSIEGDSTLGLDGQVHESLDDIRAFPSITLRPIFPDFSPDQPSVENALDQILDNRAFTYTGAIGQVINMRNIDNGYPDGDYEVTQVHEGHFGIISPLTIHRVPFYVPEGRGYLQIS